MIVTLRPTPNVPSRVDGTLPLVPHIRPRYVRRGLRSRRLALIVLCASGFMICDKFDAVAADQSSAAKSCNIGVAFIHKELPVTPEIAREAGATGTVEVEASINEAGSVLSASVYKSSGNAALDEAAVTAARQSTYAPARAHCKPVAADAIIREDFGDDPTASLDSIVTAGTKPEDVAPKDDVGSVNDSWRSMFVREKSDRILSSCAQVVHDHKLDSLQSETGLTGLSDSASDFMKSLDGEVRVATCATKRKDPRAAVKLLSEWLHSKSMPSTDEAPVQPEWAMAYLQLAQAEHLLGLRAAAEKHAVTALHLNNQLDESLRRGDIPGEAARLAPSIAVAERRQMAIDYAAATSGMSPDERDIYRREGPPDHVESFESSDRSEETWWYGDPYSIGYTFTNGHLTSVYKP